MSIWTVGGYGLVCGSKYPCFLRKRMRVIAVFFNYILRYDVSSVLYFSDSSKIKIMSGLSDLQPMGSETTATTRPLSFGEKLVGISFNPSNDDAVSTAKRLFSQAADLVHHEYKNNETSELKEHLYNHTIGEILNAQMNVVKLLTLKY